MTHAQGEEIIRLLNGLVWLTLCNFGALVGLVLVVIGTRSR